LQNTHWFHFIDSLLIDPPKTKSTSGQNPWVSLPPPNHIYINPVAQFGVKYAPTYVAYFEEQNEKINSMPWEMNGAIPIQIDTIGIANGCTDILSQAAFYPEMAFNNTYNLQVITSDEFESSELAYSQPGGCRSLTETCRALATEFDPNNYGNVPLVNEACILASDYCADFVAGPFFSSTVCAFPPRTLSI
jgi:hypothetical protein